jgi:hypothetical protein
MIDSGKRWTKAEILKAVEPCRPEDFDGHTDFSRLSFEKKLLWISRSARFVLQHQQQGPVRNDPRKR